MKLYGEKNGFRKVEGIVKQRRAHITVTYIQEHAHKVLI